MPSRARKSKRTPRRSRRLAGHSGRRKAKSQLSNEVSWVRDTNGKTTHVVLPLEHYERLLVADMARGAFDKLEDPNVQWVDADDVAIEFATEELVKARKAARLTQKQLGQRIGVPQSMISRIERRPDRTTVRTLKRIAKALGVNVNVYIGRL